MILDFEQWVITILPVEADHTALEQSIVVGHGIKLTHSATLVKKNSRRFKAEKARQFVIELQLFLSFAAGWQVGIIFCKGVSWKGDATWLQWGSGRLQTAIPGHSWHSWKMELPITSEPMLPKLLPGFIRMLRDPDMKAGFSSVLYWYNRSNNRGAGIDGSIVLAQAAFERLAWFSLVQSSKLLSIENFHSLNAEGQLRVLLGHLGIPLPIPITLTHLVKMARNKWSCGPEALVAIRNQLVHPVKAKGKTHEHPSTAVYYEAWLMAQQLLDLCILRLCDYHGTFQDRTVYEKHSDPKPVPWAG